MTAIREGVESVGIKLADLAMNSPAVYAIKIGGKLTEQWAQWFNGTLSDSRTIEGCKVKTCLVCQVRDQAELLGILKQLNALNLPLIEVCLLPWDQTPKGEWRNG